MDHNLLATLMSEQLKNILVAYLVLLACVHLALKTQLHDVAKPSQQYNEALTLLEAVQFEQIHATRFRTIFHLMNSAHSNKAL